MPLLLDHSIVGQSLTTLTIRKDREFAGCRICGAIFQSTLCTNSPDVQWTAEIALAVAIETRQWRDQHNRTHTDNQHRQFRATGLTFTPEAAHRLAPFGLVSLDDNEEIAHAMLTAPRAPVDDVENSIRGRSQIALL